MGLLELERPVVCIEIVGTGIRRDMTSKVAAAIKWLGYQVPGAFDHTLSTVEKELPSGTQTFGAAWKLLREAYTAPTFVLPIYVVDSIILRSWSKTKQEWVEQPKTGVCQSPAGYKHIAIKRKNLDLSTPWWITHEIGHALGLPHGIPGDYIIREDGSKVLRRVPVGNIMHPFTSAPWPPPPLLPEQISKLKGE